MQFKLISEVLGSFLRNPFTALERYRRMQDEHYILNEVFMHQEYWWLWRRITPGTTVIDIGGFIGDTAVYFAMNKNAESVHVLEPMPYYYDKIVHAISLSPFAGKITCENAGVATFPVAVPYASPSDSFINMKYATHRFGTRKLHMIGIQEILAQYKGRSLVIKCDIEGMERHIFDDVDLSDVYALEIECHDSLRTVGPSLRKKGFKTVILERLPQPKASNFREVVLLGAYHE